MGFGVRRDSRRRDDAVAGSIALGRLLVASTILTGIALVRRERFPARASLPSITVFGVLFLGGYSVALNAAERNVDAGTSAMIINIGRS